MWNPNGFLIGCPVFLWNTQRKALLGEVGFHSCERWDLWVWRADYPQLRKYSIVCMLFFFSVPCSGTGKRPSSCFSHGYTLRLWQNIKISWNLSPIWTWLDFTRASIPGSEETTRHACHERDSEKWKSERRSKSKIYLENPDDAAQETQTISKKIRNRKDRTKSRE